MGGSLDAVVLDTSYFAALAVRSYWALDLQDFVEGIPYYIPPAVAREHRGQRERGVVDSFNAPIFHKSFESMYGARSPDVVYSPQLAHEVDKVRDRVFREEHVKKKEKLSGADRAVMATAVHLARQGMDVGVISNDIDITLPIQTYAHRGLSLDVFSNRTLLRAPAELDIEYLVLGFAFRDLVKLSPGSQYGLKFYTEGDAPWNARLVIAAGKRVNGEMPLAVDRLDAPLEAQTWAYFSSADTSLTFVHPNSGNFRQGNWARVDFDVLNPIIPNIKNSVKGVRASYLRASYPSPASP